MRAGETMLCRRASCLGRCWIASTSFAASVCQVFSAVRGASIVSIVRRRVPEGTRARRCGARRGPIGQLRRRVGDAGASPRRTTTRLSTLRECRPGIENAKRIPSFGLVESTIHIMPSSTRVGRGGDGGVSSCVSAATSRSGQPRVAGNVAPGGGKRPRPPNAIATHRSGSSRACGACRPRASPFGPAGGK